MKGLVFLLVALTSISAFALDCNVEKNGQNKGRITRGSALVDSYQHDVIEAGEYVVMNIFDRKTSKSSARVVAPIPSSDQVVSVSLETNDGTYSIKCK